MKRSLVLVLLSGLTLLGGSWSYAQSGEELYKSFCASCHGVDGQGVPGTYPFIDGPIGRLSTIPEGREFLVASILFGLEGELVQRGVTYDGVMPGFAGALSDEQVATLLNWLKRQWKNAQLGAGTPEYTPQEVAAVRAQSLTPKQVFERLAEVEAILHANNPGGRGQGCDHAPGPMRPRGPRR